MPSCWWAKLIDDYDSVFDGEIAPRAPCKLAFFPSLSVSGSNDKADFKLVQMHKCTLADAK